MRPIIREVEVNYNDKVGIAVCPFCRVFILVEKDKLYPKNCKHTKRLTIKGTVIVEERKSSPKNKGLVK